MLLTAFFLLSNLSPARVDIAPVLYFPFSTLLWYNTNPPHPKSFQITSCYGYFLVLLWLLLYFYFILFFNMVIMKPLTLWASTAMSMKYSKLADMGPFQEADESCLFFHSKLEDLICIAKVLILSGAVCLQALSP